MSDLKKTPESVVRAGSRLVRLRRLAADLESEIDASLPDIRAAIAEVTDKKNGYGAKQTQAGETLALLRSAQTAPGNIAHAHDILRGVLGLCGIAEPTDEQIVETISTLSAQRKAAPDVGTASIR